MTDTTATPTPFPVAARHQVAVISASVRDQRMSAVVTDWVLDALHATPDVEVDLIDLARTALPDDRLLQPGGGETRSEVADRIAAAEAYVLVSPEYNHSYPASLKQLIDWHYSEWMFKPAAIVSYGSQGGHAAAEHLRGVLAELHVVTTRRAVALRAPWEALDAEGRFRPDDAAGTALRGAVAELRWWAGVLTHARTHHPFDA